MILTHAHAAVLSIIILLLLGGAAITLMITATPAGTGAVIDTGAGDVILQDSTRSAGESTALDNSTGT